MKTSFVLKVIRCPFKKSGSGNLFILKVYFLSGEKRDFFHAMFSKSFHLISLRNTVSPASILSRNYAFKTDLKTKWVHPEKIPCIKPQKSGDLSPFESPDQKRFLLNFDKSEELKTADALVKKIFTLEQNRRYESVETFKKETVDLVKRHELDLGSYESKSK